VLRHNAFKPKRLRVLEHGGAIKVAAVDPRSMWKFRQIRTPRRSGRIVGASRFSCRLTAPSISSMLPMPDASLDQPVDVIAALVVALGALIRSTSSLPSMPPKTR
jgi:hypothetical protein